MKSSLFILALLAFLISTATAMPDNTRFQAAKCLAKKRKCGTYLQRKTRVCRARIYARNQSPACHQLACAWCKQSANRNSFPCTADNVKAICRAVAAGRRVTPFIPRRRPSTTRPPVTRKPTKPDFNPGSGSAPKPGCVYSGSTSVVVSLGNVKMASGWDRISRPGLKGLIYKKNGGGGVDSAKPSTTMCFKMKVSVSGDYLASAVSAAPHPTEYNDMWISSSLGFKLYRKGQSIKSANPGKMLKAYQNKGKKLLNSRISTIDHNAHAFIVPDLKAGRILTYCMSGRSSKYEVYKLMIVKCESSLCKNGFPNTERFTSGPGSKCS